MSDRKVDILENEFSILQRLSTETSDVDSHVSSLTMIDSYKHFIVVDINGPNLLKNILFQILFEFWSEVRLIGF